MKRLCLSLIVTLLVAGAVFLQSTKDCPTVWIDGPTSSITSVRQAVNVQDLQVIVWDRGRPRPASSGEFAQVTS